MASPLRANKALLISLLAAFWAVSVDCPLIGSQEKSVKPRQTSAFAPVLDQADNAALFVGVNEFTVDESLAPLKFQKGSGCSDRVLRGGSWVDNDRYLRCAIRFGSPPDLRLVIINHGFRVTSDAQ